MLKAIEQLIKGERSSVGNHRVETTEEQGKTIKRFYYHSTAICTVDTTSRCFILDNGGWDTSSTSRAISCYKQYYGDYCRYKQLFKDYDSLLDALVAAPSKTTYYSCITGVHDITGQFHIIKKPLEDESGKVINSCTFFISGDSIGEQYKFNYKNNKDLKKELASMLELVLDII